MVVLESAPEEDQYMCTIFKKLFMHTKNDTVLEVDGHAGYRLAVFLMSPWWISYMDVPKLCGC